MIGFLTLTRPVEGAKVIVGLAQIEEVSSDDKGRSIIRFTSGRVCVVRESLEDLEEMIAQLGYHDLLRRLG